jgi:hypothetical protein
MFGRIGQAAETMANDVGTSRRWFLGRVGRAAVVAIGVVGGMLALPKEGQTANKCCHYGCVNGYSFNRRGPCHQISGCFGTEFPC